MTPGIWNWACCCGGTAKYKVGVVNYNTEPSAMTYMSAYLDDIVAYDSRVINVPITESVSTADLSDYNCIFLWLPTAAYTTEEKAAIKSYFESGEPYRRIVLVAEWEGRTAANTYLNSLALYCGLKTRFSGNIDSTGNSFSVNNMHYLTNGVLMIRHAVVTLASPQPGSWAVGLVAHRWNVNELFITGEDRENAGGGYLGGSAVFIGDSNIFDPATVGAAWDTVPERNFKFCHNLCTQYRELGE